VRIISVYKEILRDMPLSDVMNEGGEEGETVKHFVTRYRRYFQREQFVVPKVGGVGIKTELRIIWNCEYTVVLWEWITRW
jgi:hypothetical protein